MENGSELDSRVVDGLRGMRPDRWDRWVKAGRKGNEYRKTLRTLVQHKDSIPLYLQFSRYVERLVDACGVSVSEAGNALGISLEHGYDVLDQPTFSTLEAAESLCLDPRYVRIALQLACFEPAELETIDATDKVSIHAATSLVEDSEVHTTFLTKADTLNGLSHEARIERMSSILAKREGSKSPEDAARLEQCGQTFAQYSA